MRVCSSFRGLGQSNNSTTVELESKEATAPLPLITHVAYSSFEARPPSRTEHQPVSRLCFCKHAHAHAHAKHRTALTHRIPDAHHGSNLSHQSTSPPVHNPPPVLVVPDPVSARPAELRCSRTQGLVQSCVSSGPSPQRCGTSHGYWTPPSTGCGAANALGPGPKVPLLVLENKCVDIAKPPNRLCRRLLTDHIANKTSLTD